MTTTINPKVILTGLLFSIVVFLMYTAVQSVSNPRSTSRPIVTTDYVKFIYRGIPIGHKAFADASNGIARPIGGHNDPLQHRDGNNNSVFTSWTTDITIAYRYATNDLYGCCTGIILMKKVDISGSQFVDGSSLNGGDIYGESEILVKGMINGCIPILVKPGMDNNMIMKLIKNAI